MFAGFRCNGCRVTFKTSKLMSCEVKPFNPVLGETYEYVPASKAFKSLCEQVSHHPPIGIAHSTCDEWTLSQESHIATRFWGTSVDVQSLGDNHLTLHKQDDHYTWKAPKYASTFYYLSFSQFTYLLLPSLPIFPSVRINLPIK